MKNNVLYVNEWNYEFIGMYMNSSSVCKVSVFSRRSWNVLCQGNHLSAGFADMLRQLTVQWNFMDIDNATLIIMVNSKNSYKSGIFVNKSSVVIFPSPKVILTMVLITFLLSSDPGHTRAKVTRGEDLSFNWSSSVSRSSSVFLFLFYAEIVSWGTATFSAKSNIASENFLSYVLNDWSSCSLSLVDSKDANLCKMTVCSWNKVASFWLFALWLKIILSTSLSSLLQKWSFFREVFFQDYGWYHSQFIGQFQEIWWGRFGILGLLVEFSSDQIIAFYDLKIKLISKEQNF